MNESRDLPGAFDAPSEAVIAALRDKGLVVLAVIGRGANSIVYRAHDERLARDVAVKVIDAQSATPSALARFQQEVSVVGRLRHPHILPLHDAGIAGDGSAFAVMPVAGGTTLREYARGKALPLRVVVTLVSEVADALAYAHDQGLIHRDIKPENIFVEHEHAVVADFGLAIRGGDRSSALQTKGGDQEPTNERLTASGLFVGTPLYVSPEQLAGATIDARADIFSLGAVCFEMLTGSVPFQGPTVQETLTARLLRPPRPMSSYGVRIPPRVEAVVLRALRRDPGDRPRTVLEFRDALRAAYRAATPLAQRRVLAGGLVILGLGIVVGVAGELRARRESDMQTLDRTRVVIADFDNETADSAYATWGDVAGDLIATRLARVPGLNVVTSQRWLPRSQQVQRQPGAPASLRALALETNAATVLTGGYYRNEKHLELILELTDARSGKLMRSFGPVAVPALSPDSAILALGKDVALALDSIVVQRRAANRSS